MTSVDKPMKITLLGVKQSKPGNQFLFLGETENCIECRLRGACLKLEEGRIFEVASVKDTVHACAVFEDGVQTVEIFEPSYLVTTGAKLAVKGATFTFTPRDCNIIECPHYQHHCCPSYLSKGEKLQIVSISKDPTECAQGYQLKLVTADRISD